MRVILLRDVAKIGNAGEVHEVSDGYARNFLIMRGLARFASAKIEKEALRTKEARTMQARGIEDEIKGNLKILDGQEIHIKGRAGESGHLFAGLHPVDIVRAIQKEKGIMLPESVCGDLAPIKDIGTHKIPLSGGGVSATISLFVEREN